MNDALFPRRFTEAMRPGAYLRIFAAGDLSATDEIRIVEKPNHDLTIRDVFRIFIRDRHESSAYSLFGKCRKAGKNGRKTC